MNDDLLQQLENIRAERALKQKRRRLRSPLAHYRAEILYLAEAGASHEDIRLWLSTYKQIKVHATTVGRVLKRWREEEQ